MKPIDGGPAFPAQPLLTYPPGVTVTPRSGMTLRQYYAAEAMKPLIQNFLSKDLHLDNSDWMEGLAGDAFRMADEMLEAEEE